MSGRGGATIRSIADESGAKISMTSKDESIFTQERILSISGSKVSCIKCLTMVNEIKITHMTPDLNDSSYLFTYWIICSYISIDWVIYLFVYLFISSFIYLFIYFFIYLFIYSFTCLFIHLFIHLFTSSFFIYINFYLFGIFVFN